MILLTGKQLQMIQRSSLLPP